MIAIVDYGVGNLFSLSSSVRSLGAEVRVTRGAADLRAADHILLPGVGAFADAMAKLEATGLVPVLREETQKKPLNVREHFLYLVCHSLKHFLHSGFGIRQACDMIYFAKNYHDQFDWEEIRSVMREYHMEAFAMNVLDIGVCYLGISWEEMGLTKPYDIDIDCTALLDDMLDGGIFGQNDMNRVHSANITLNAAEHEKASAASGIAASLFPDKEYMKTNYDYARKYPFLLPAAYIQRILKYLLKRKKTGQNTGEKSSTQIGMERVKLLEKYKIVDK